MSSHTHSDLPTALRQRLRSFEAMLCRTEFGFAALVGLAVVVGSQLLLFLSDRFWDTPALLRLVLLGVSIAAVATGAAFWIRHWILKRRDLPALAELIQFSHPQLGDRLQGIIELTENAVPGESEALRRAAIAQVSREAEAIDFADAVPRTPLRRAGLLAGGLALMICTGHLLAHDAFVSAAQRLIHPFEGPPRYTFTRFAPHATRLIVPHGKDLTIEIPIAAASKYMPGFVHAEFTENDGLVAEVENGSAKLLIPDVFAPGTLRFRAGDAVSELDIVPLHPPALARVRATVTPPAYVDRPEQELDVRGNRLQVLHGSTARVHGRATRPLRSMQFGEHAVTVSGHAFEAEPLLVQARYDAILSYTDVHGMHARGTDRIVLHPIADRAPTVALASSANSMAMLANEVAALRYEASDDYGVKDLSINLSWRGADADGVPPLLLQSFTGDTQRVVLEASLSFAPEAYDIAAGATLEIRAGARDFLPNRAPTWSEPLRIRILTVEEHAELVRRAIEALQSDLEQLVREQDGTREATEALAAKASESPESKADPGAQSELREQSDRQSEIQSDLEELARDAAEIAQKAMKNEQFSDQNVSEMAELAQAMENTAESSMEQAREALDASSQASSKGQQGEQAEAAAEAQAQAMSELQEMQESLNENAESMMAESFVNRLRLAASVQNEISTGLGDEIDTAAGLSASRLPAALGRTRTDQTDTQRGNSEEVAYIQDDLSGFFVRTGRVVLEQIHTNMVGEAVVSALDANAVRIGDNHLFLATDASARWATKLSEWADLLEDDNEKQREEQRSQSSPSESLSEQEMAIMLRLERARQQEESIRARTRRINRDARERDYADRAYSLSREQDALARDIIQLERIITHPKVARLVEKVGGEMLNVKVGLRKPVTDQRTIAIQTEIIELLAASMDAAMQQSSSSAAMAQMMQMMGMPSEGGGMAGGPGGNRSSAEGGDTDQARSSERSAGRTPPVVPREFRDALRNYLKRTEALGP